MPSFRQERLLSLASSDLTEKSLADLKETLKQQLNSGVHGFCASPYLEGQKPGDQLTEEQIRKRLEVLKPHTKWIRSFSTTEGNELIPKVARELGIKTMVGAWLGDDPETNRKEVANLIELVNQGLVDIAAVGNEVLYRGDLTESELLEYIHEVKSKIKLDVPVGYVDAYYEFQDHPAVADACDVILANCYPFWEGCPLEHSLLYMKEMFRIATEAGKGKQVIITETGWPDQGSNLRGAEPSTENAIKYFINAQQWSKEENIELFYFSSFDESWKVGNEGDVGAFWGVWDKNEKLKY
ncbi:MAG: glycosyl hydrolase family 17 protein [Algoriphagus sp.]|jgi:glucan 1,3-beta-glucosidase|uniref:glycoside hydrolase family 17 protein n=1 Tax=Algoriphagus sp. TaxID=1872435 RepID=UPI0026097DE5|nr:glycosyl hydrolase family 17 protein [Algoriphagus sp.]MDG1277873.1 glycosyl hydrolase family 17 protein [Algoriphagus sp.]